MKEINFTANLDQPGQTVIIFIIEKANFIIEKAKETVLDFSQGTVTVL